MLQDETARARIAVYLNDDPLSGATYGFYVQQNQAAERIFDAWLAPLRDLRVRRNVIEGIGSTVFAAIASHDAIRGEQIPRRSE